MREDAEQLKEDLEGLAEVPDGILQIVNEHAATVVGSFRYDSQCVDFDPTRRLHMRTSGAYTGVSKCRLR